MDKFIFLIENNLDDKLCIEIIDKFDNDNNIKPGLTGYTLNKETKNTKDLFISNKINWKSIDNILKKKLNESINKYIDNLYIKYKIQPSFLVKCSNLSDSGYQIQKYNKNEGFYNWHDDYCIDKKFGTRVLTFLWYLNDVKEGGETEFINGIKIKPKEGTLLLFPSDWSYVHKGNMPLTNDKYICTGWLYTNWKI